MSDFRDLVLIDEHQGPAILRKALNDAVQSKRCLRPTPVTAPSGLGMDVSKRGGGRLLATAMWLFAPWRRRLRDVGTSKPARTERSGRSSRPGSEAEQLVPCLYFS